jgi:hypothetical protein
MDSDNQCSLADSLKSIPEPVFVNPLRSPGIDSQPGGPELQPHLLYQPARLHRLAESIFGLYNVFKDGHWAPKQFTYSGSGSKKSSLRGLDGIYVQYRYLPMQLTVSDKLLI